MSTEDQVRARIQDWLTGAGVHESEVALEVLYWLPSEFLEGYRELFMRALDLGDSGKALDPGMSKAIVAGQLRTGARQRVVEGRGAQAGGKRYYRGEWIVKDEKLVEVKRRVDDRLRRIIPGVMKLMEGSQGSTPGLEDEGSEGGKLVEMRKGKGRKVCERCGRIAGRDWVRCPYPHA